MEKDFVRLMGLFQNNGVYSLNEDTECVGYYTTNSRKLDISDISEGYVFSDENSENQAPAITIHDRTVLLLITKYGVVNFHDLRFAMKLRKQIEPSSCVYEINENAELKHLLDKKLVSKGLVVRYRIKHEYMLDGERVTRHEYAYCTTAKGVNVINGAMDCLFRDSNSYRLMSDINIRDSIGRMAVAHIALYLTQYGFNPLENHFSNVKGGSVERYVMLSYNPKKNIEVVFQPLYFVRNPKIETEEEYNEKKRNTINNVFRWLSASSEHEKDGKAAERIVVLCCNSIKDYAHFCEILGSLFMQTSYFDLIGHVYATSTGLIDAATVPEDAFYRHTRMEEVDGRYVPMDGEITSFFGEE